MPPILLHWRMQTEVNVGIMVVDVELPPVFHDILLPCNTWEQRGSQTEWSQTWKSMNLNCSTWTELHPWHSLTLEEHLWWANSEHERSERGVLCFSGGNSDRKEKSHCRRLCIYVTPWKKECLDQLIHVNKWIRNRNPNAELHTRLHALKTTMLTLEYTKLCTRSNL